DHGKREACELVLTILAGDLFQLDVLQVSVLARVEVANVKRVDGAKCGLANGCDKTGSENLCEDRNSLVHESLLLRLNRLRWRRAGRHPTVIATAGSGG